VRPIESADLVGRVAVREEHDAGDWLAFEPLGERGQRAMQGRGLAVVGQLREVLHRPQCRVEGIAPQIEVLLGARQPGRFLRQAGLEDLPARLPAAAIGQLQAAAVVGDDEQQIAAGTRARSGKEWLDEADGQKSNARRLERAGDHADPGWRAGASIGPDQHDQGDRRQSDRDAQPLPGAKH
jgi:hypothetical protein